MFVFLLHKINRTKAVNAYNTLHTQCICRRAFYLHFSVCNVETSTSVCSVHCSMYVASVKMDHIAVACVTAKHAKAVIKTECIILDKSRFLIIIQWNTFIIVHRRTYLTVPLASGRICGCDHKMV